MSLDEAPSDLSDPQSIHEIARLAIEVDEQTAELDAIAWNLPRPIPERLPPEDAWPADGAAT